MEDLDPDLFEDDFDELDVDEEDLEDIEEMFLEDESEDSEAQPAPNTNKQAPHRKVRGLFVLFTRTVSATTFSYGVIFSFFDFLKNIINCFNW